jgi:SAM-dependent methyltransferase
LVVARDERKDHGLLREVMRPIYRKQGTFFRKAYETGEHGWPVEGPTPQVTTLVERLGHGSGKKALDLGCGEGRHTILLAERGYDVVALDIEPLAVRKAATFVTRAGASAHFVTGDALNLPFRPGYFDIVLDYGCFHHVVTRDWPRYRREVCRVLRPGGHLILSVFSTKFKHHVAERRSRNWIVHRNHYDHFFTIPEITRIFQDSFDVKVVIEEHEGLNGYYHSLMQAKKSVGSC